MFARIHPLIMTFEFYTILKMETLLLSLSLPFCCQCRFKRYIVKQTNSKRKETVLLGHQPAFPTTCMLSFPFSFDHMIRSFFFFSFFTLIFSFFKDYNKNIKALAFHSFFLSTFLSFILFFLFPFDFSFLSLKILSGTLAQRLECSPMARETWVQSQVESYQRL